MCVMCFLQRETESHWKTMSACVNNLVTFEIL